MKLTKPQEEFLRAMPTTGVENYAPARKLVELGLAKMIEQKYGSHQYNRTPEGDAWIANKDAA